jgi:glycerol-3-phosphate dehydrogenase
MIRSQPIPPHIEDAPFDLIIIGAGINGTGIARDAAMRGLKVLMLDQDDICSGTSAWSSRLIHGGLRYLEHVEIDLVRESLRERERLFANAPHLVVPLEFVIPLYKRNKRPPWMIKIGMLGYDVLSFDKSVGTHKMMSRDEVLRRMPGLDPHELKGAAMYYDGQVELAERLCVENALSARDHGALVLTYARVDRLLLENNTVRGVEFSDRLDGGTHRACAPVTLNVSGPWVDEVLLGTGRKVKRFMGGTKGTHLIVDPFPGAPNDAIYLEAVTDGRPIFVIPWEAKYLIGTTDIRYEGDLNYVKADEAEIEYLLKETNLIIPEAKLTRDSVLYTYCGVRPLPYQASGSAGSITRRHIVHDHAPEIEGLLSVIGGKLTTFRSLAEEAVDDVFKKLAKKAPKCTTGQVPLPGAETEDYAAFCQKFSESSKLSPETSRRLLHVYGTRSTEILDLIDQDPDLTEPFSPDMGAIAAEIVLALQQEMAETLADVLLRRTMVGFGTSVGLDADENAAKVAQKYLGWDRQRAEEEVAAYRQYIERFHPRQLPNV